MIIKNKYQLKRFIHYNQYTGEFTRIQRASSGHTKLGKLDNIKLNEGGELRIENIWYRATRLAYLYMEGVLPEGRVIQIDGDKTNFKWNNLALREHRKRGSIAWVESKKRFQYYVDAKYIRVYKTLEEAEAALNATLDENDRQHKERSNRA